MKISVIILAFKVPITLESLEHCPFQYEVILSKKVGLGYARNFGARCANNRFLVFFDGDLILKPEIWKVISIVRAGSFGMLQYYFPDARAHRPCSRVVCIWADDFWRMGGFDESIKYGGADTDFYLRAIKNGLRFIPIPNTYVRHKSHPPRWENPLLNMKISFEHAKILVRHGWSFFKLYWKSGVKSYFFIWIRRPRTHLPNLIGFFYYLLRGSRFES